jgi:phage terminase small subunit
MARALTERQQKFLAVLMDEAGGDISTAKIMAGYSANTSNLEVTNSLKEEIIDVS